MSQESATWKVLRLGFGDDNEDTYSEIEELSEFNVWRMVDVDIEPVEVSTMAVEPVTDRYSVAVVDFTSLEGAEVMVESVIINFTLAELLVLQLLLMGTLVLCFSYVRLISRERLVLPNIMHRLFCPLLSVLRWEGFDNDKPIYALLFGCWYTVFCWTPTLDELDDEGNTTEAYNAENDVPELDKYFHYYDQPEKTNGEDLRASLLNSNRHFFVV